MKVNLSAEAVKDVDKIFEYYNEKSGVDLASRFFLEFETRYKSLDNKHEIGSLRHEHIFKNIITRFIMLDTFPYIIFYTVDENSNQVQVLRVFHQSRNFLAHI